MNIRNIISWILVVLLCSGSAAVAEIIFGPGPRALDNRLIFAEPEPWKELATAGVTGVTLNASFVMVNDFRQGPDEQGAYRPRPKGTYLEQSDLEHLAIRLSENGLSLTYAGGLGLSGENCSPHLASMEAGRRAALLEYEQSIARLHAAGITINALNLDGLFLRLISDSGKRSSCNVGIGRYTHAEHGFDIETTVKAAQAYIIAMRDLVESGNPENTKVTIRLMINLPNWQVLNLPRLGNHDGPATTDLRQVFAAFTALQKSVAAPPEIAEIVIDYPYSIVKSAPRTFVGKMKHLWNMTRNLNPDSMSPAFGVITNTVSYVNACLKNEWQWPKAPPFLAFRDLEQPIDKACLKAQIGTADRNKKRDSDADYMRDSLTYLIALQPDGELADQLVVRDGTRVSEFIDHFYVQSWHINPVRNDWYMAQLVEYMTMTSGEQQ